MEPQCCIKKFPKEPEPVHVPLHVEVAQVLAKVVGGCVGAVVLAFVFGAGIKVISHVVGFLMAVVFYAYGWMP